MFPQFLKSDITKILSFSVLAGILITLLFRMNVDIAIYSDFLNNYNGASIVRVGKGSELYNLNTQINNQANLIQNPKAKKYFLPFRNLPFVALLLAPLSYLPLIVSYKIFLLGVFIILLILSYYLKKTFKSIKKLEYWLLFTFLFLPNLWSIFVTQLAPLIALIALFIFRFVRKKKDMLAGCFTGLLLIKPQYLIIIPFIFLLVKRKKNYILGLVLVLTVLLGISVFVSGLNSLISYPSFIIQTESAQFGSRPGQIFTIFSLLKVIFENHSFISLFAINGILYLLVLLFFSVKRKDAGLNLSFASLILLTIAFSIHTMLQDLSLTIVSLSIILSLVSLGKLKTEAFFCVGSTLSNSPYNDTKPYELDTCRICRNRALFVNA